RSGETTTLLSHRYYLQDAAFTLAVTSEDTTLLHKSAEKLRRPRWAPYLGRRSCPPSGPLILTTVTATPVEHLLKLPLTRPAPGRNGPSQEATVPVEFASDLPLDGLSADGRSPADPILGEAQDEPLSFTPLDRRYRARPVHRITLRLPATQCAGYGTQYLTRLSSYLADHQLEVSSS
ncbi:type I-E CRISPR-associated protein Cas5/CasD, partial [Streptomyces daliensis]|nr:type I-E CRISPR-associated protein Cas5/CasD [Streptomyces daliensis]